MFDILCPYPISLLFEIKVVPLILMGFIYYVIYKHHQTLHKLIFPMLILVCLYLTMGYLILGEDDCVCYRNYDSLFCTPENCRKETSLKFYSFIADTIFMSSPLLVIFLIYIIFAKTLPLKVIRALIFFCIFVSIIYLTYQYN
jgi:hypothetical protein